MSQDGEKKIEDALKKCQISEPDLPKDIELTDTFDSTLLSKWPKPKVKVPTIFLHKSVDFAKHVKKLIIKGVHFYQPYLGTNYTRINCHTFNDHKAMLQYFDNNNLPYHTFGHPTKRKMKVVIRNLPKDTNLKEFLKVLKSANIPVLRVHKMHVKKFAEGKDFLALAVVPYTDEGKKLLQLKKVFGNEVKLEPPIPKTRQCHRCQKWGHSQRYCHGEVKCVKCAGDHFSKKCTRDPEKEPPTCANCGGNHTASYRECFYCPDSDVYKQNQKSKLNKGSTCGRKERVLVTMDNCDKLYKKIRNIPKHAEAVPF